MKTTRISSIVLLSFLISMPFGLFVRAEDKVVDKIDKKEAADPAGTAKDVETDKPDVKGDAKEDPETSEEVKEKQFSMHTEEFFNLKQEYMKEKSAIETPIKEKLSGLVSKYLAEAEGFYDEKKKSGNVKGMAIARELKSIMAECKSQIDKTGNFKIPEKYRKDISDTMTRFAKEKEDAEAEFEPRLSEFEESFKVKFSDIGRPKLEELKKKGDDIEDLIKTKFEEFKTTEIRASELNKKESETNEEGGEGEAMKDDGAPVFATKGDGNIWIDVGEFSAEMRGMDVLNIKIDAPGEFSDLKYNPMTGAESELKYKGAFAVPPRADYGFKLIRIPGKYTVDVLEWPSPGNSMNLIVRTKPVAKDPAPHGFMIQASLPDSEIYKVFNKNEAKKRAAAIVNEKGMKDSEDGKIQDEQASDESDASKQKRTGPPIAVSVTTKPEGASIYVDGILQVENKLPSLTPCKIKIPQGAHSVRLVKTGYLDKTLSDFTPGSRNNRIVSDMQPDPKFRTKKFSFGSASSSAKGCGLQVKNGDKLFIDPKGTWTCGDRNDKCDAGGYPNNQKYFKYYIDSAKDLRIVRDVPYGAMLYKIGKDGEPEAVPMNGKPVEVKEDGELFFDINELPDARKGNTGSIEVQISVTGT